MSDLVTFLNSRGEEISNDPRWHAQKVLAGAGMTPVNSSLVEENESLRAQIAALQASQADSQGVEDDHEDDGDDDADAFSAMGAAELKAYAKENDIDIKGLKKVGEVREALRAAASQE